MWQARRQKDLLTSIPTSLKELDFVLKGGIPAGHVTEVSICVLFQDYMTPTLFHDLFHLCCILTVTLLHTSINV